MSFGSDKILDRYKLKSSLLKWKTFAILLTLLLVVLYGNSRSFNFSNRFNLVSSDFIARININGEIAPDLYRDKVITELQNNKNVKAVIVHINSPGGSGPGGETLYNSLKALSKEKPTVTVMDNMATSAAYMAALGTNHIIAHRLTITGSIGVILEAFSVVQGLHKLGIEPLLIKSSELKASPSPFELITLKSRQTLQESIDNAHLYFLSILQLNRSFTEDEAKEKGDGRIYTGMQALDAKLIDELGGEAEAINWLYKVKQVKAPVVDIALIPPKSFIQRLKRELNTMMKSAINSFFPLATTSYDLKL